MAQPIAESELGISNPVPYPLSQDFHARSESGPDQSNRICLLERPGKSHLKPNASA